MIEPLRIKEPNSMDMAQIDYLCIIKDIAAFWMEAR